MKHMYEHEYSEIHAYYENKRVWAEFDADGEMIISLAISELPPVEFMTEHVNVHWAAVEVLSFRYSRLMNSASWALRLKSHATPFKYDWFFVGDALQRDLMEIVMKANKNEDEGE